MTGTGRMGQVGRAARAGWAGLAGLMGLVGQAGLVGPLGLVGLLFATPAAAQVPPLISIRPFVTISEERLAAANTFEAIFGTANEPLYGGGLQVTERDRFYVELSASKFRQTGQRAFRTSDGQVFHVGIPLTATLTPLELTGGYRYHRWKHVIPYGGAGVGWYRYTESSSFSTGAENVNTRHAGVLVEGGAEIRLHRWLGVAVDARYTHVPGILGTGGISKDVSENDIGGVAARIKVIVGR
jgi:opacity protein-like surface antigen